MSDAVKKIEKKGKLCQKIKEITTFQSKNCGKIMNFVQGLKKKKKHISFKDLDLSKDCRKKCKYVES